MRGKQGNFYDVAIKKLRTLMIKWNKRLNKSQNSNWKKLDKLRYQNKIKVTKKLLWKHLLELLFAFNIVESVFDKSPAMSPIATETNTKLMIMATKNLDLLALHPANLSLFVPFGASASASPRHLLCSCSMANFATQAS